MESELTQEEIIKLRENYYAQTFVRFEILKCLRGREFAVLDKLEHKGNIRYMHPLNYDYLLLYFDKLRLVNRNLTFYKSVATLTGLPKVNFNLKTRMKKDDYIDFDKNYEKNIQGYDFLFDFDSHDDFDLCKKEVIEFINILREMKIPYEILNSSEKGIHVTIPHRFFDESDIPKNIKLFKDIAYNIKGIYDFKFIDISIFDSKRLAKLPYSYTERGYIALPLTFEQLKSFTPEFVKCENVLKNIQIKNRGLLTENYGLDESQLKINTQKFIKEYS